MKLKIVSRRKPDGKFARCPSEHCKVVNAATGEMLENVQSIDVHVGFDCTKVTIVLLDPVFDMRDYTPEELAALEAK